MITLPSEGTVVDVRNVPATKPNTIPFLRKLKPELANNEQFWVTGVVPVSAGSKLFRYSIVKRDDQVVTLFDRFGAECLRLTATDSRVTSNVGLPQNVRVEVSNG